ncbi:MAG: PBP1A family penicillin-binding protein [Candidatus Niyogibacteria bacterium]|nr:PBP1A family penicillin-binding protein [Candidatus Niyogibacteria bacterium]
MPSRKKKQARIKTALLGLAAALALFGGFLSLWAMTLEIPDFRAFDERKVVQSTKIYDRTEKVLLFDVHADVRRTVVPFEKIPRHVKNAVVAIEDSNFYNHNGIDLSGIFRAVVVNVFSGSLSQGGSTITQQLIKHALLTPEKTFARKLKEALLALKIEKTFGKEEILDFYLNEVPFGSSIYGVGSASQNFFAKPVEELTLAESAYLAALLKAPTYFSPYGQHPDELDKRKNLVLERMLDLDFIGQEEFDGAEKERVSFVNRDDLSIKAPHFVMFIREYLASRYGEDALEKDGLKVITTLDWSMQEKAQRLTKEFVEDEEEKFNVFNAGLTAVDPKTGQILVMVGSKDWSGEPEPAGCAPGFNCKFEPKLNVTTYRNGRQPGSAFKPFVYATAFGRGYTPETIVFDLPTEFNPSCDPEVNFDKEEPKDSPCYHPQNYDEKFRGPVTFRNALAQSINIPAVKALYLAGIGESIKTASDLGIQTLNEPDRYGLTLVLGGGEVRLLEMVGAYGVFANDGIKNPSTAILKVEDSSGNVLEEFKPSPTQALDADTARRINSILSDNEARAPAFSLNSPLHFPDRDVAAKTGTTNDSRDAWVVGYTPNLAWGVWFGNNDNSEMVKSIAGFIAAPLWNAFFNEVKGGLADEKFIEPRASDSKKAVLNGEWRGSITYTIDKISGKRATEFTPSQFREEKPITQIHSILNWVSKDDPRGPIPENPSEDPQFRMWEYAVRLWAGRQGIREETAADIPQTFDNVHRPEYAPSVSFIKSPATEISPSGILSFSISAAGKFPVAEIDVILGGKFLGSMKNQPYAFSADLSKISGLGPEETLIVNVYDIVGNKSFVQKQILIR